MIDGIDKVDASDLAWIHVALRTDAEDRVADFRHHLFIPILVQHASFRIKYVAAAIAVDTGCRESRQLLYKGHGIDSEPK